MSELEALLPALLERLVEQIASRVVELQREQGSEAPGGGQLLSPWLGIAAAADYLDWPRQRLYKLTASGAIPHYKQEGRLLFHRQELDQWLRAFAQPVKALAFPPEESY